MLHEACAEYYPENMSDLSVYKGLCSPRTAEFCKKTCGDRPCGYYREIVRRGIDIEAMSRRKPIMKGVEVTEEEIAALKQYRKDHKLKVDELCRAFHISRHTFVNYTNGRRVTPRIKGRIRKAMQEVSI